MKVCPKCGAHSDNTQFVGPLCINCFNPEIKLPTKIKINIGKVTNKIKHRNKWIENSMENINKIIASYVKGNFETVEYNLDSQELTITIDVNETAIVLKRHLVVQLKPILEEHIAKIRGGYFEGIIQIRGKHSKIPYWSKKLIYALEYKDVSVSKVDDLKEGIDLYITDKKAVPSVLHKMNLKFLRTKSLYGVKDGHRVYRDTFLVRVGEPIKDKGHKY